MNDGLDFLKTLKEQELTELVVIPLLEALGYRDIRYTHGVMEYGKDVVCVRSDPLEGPRYIGFTIKAHALRGSVSSVKSVRVVLFQAEQALKEPFVSPLNGKMVRLSHIYVLTSHTISQTAISSIRHQLEEQSSRVSFIDGPRLVSLLQDNLPGLLSTIPDPTHVYLLGIQQRFLQVSTAVALGSQREFKLTDIYTGGGLTPTTPEEAAFLSFASLQLERTGIPPRSVYLEHKYLVLLADVGAGKTTLLKKLALDLMSADGNGARADPQVVPIFIELASLSKKALKSFEAFSSWLSSKINERIRGLNFDLLQNGQRSGEFLLLLDGFDEVSRGHGALESYLSQVVDHFPCGVIITSRPSRIPDLRSPYTFFRIDPFSKIEIKSFLEAWFHQADRVEEILAHIESDQTLLGFCRTPLLLTLFAVLAASDPLDQMPSRKAEIYDSLAALLLGRWDSMRSVTNHFTPGIKSYVLERVAYSIHRKGRKSFTKDQLVAVTVPLLEDPRDNSEAGRQEADAKARLLFDELIFRSSLIRRGDGAHFAFSHLSFQEFFCSRHLIRLGDRKAVDRLLFANWWKNVLAFYFGLTRSMDGVRFSNKRAAEKGHVLVEYLAEADYTPKDYRENVFRLVATQLIASRRLPASVIVASQRLNVELLAAAEAIVERRRPRDPVPIGFFDFCLQLGTPGLSTALRHRQLLGLYPPDVMASSALRSIRYLNMIEGQKMLAESLNHLLGEGLRALRRLSKRQRVEQANRICKVLKSSIKELSLDSSIESRLKSRIMDSISYTKESFSKLL